MTHLLLALCLLTAVAGAVALVERILCPCNCTPMPDTDANGKLWWVHSQGCPLRGKGYR